MSYASVGEVITETSMMTVGLKVNPHLSAPARSDHVGDQGRQQTLRWWRASASSSGPSYPRKPIMPSCLSAGKSLAAVNQGYRRK